MTWVVVGYWMAGVTVTGGALAAVPRIWRFVVAASRVPVMAEKIYAEFAPNGGGSMRDSINTLKDDSEHLRETTHRIEGTVSAAVDVTSQTLVTVAEHTAADDVRFTEILSRLDTIDASLVQVQRLDAEVKADLTKFNEIDALGREGRIDRRQP